MPIRRSAFVLPLSIALAGCQPGSPASTTSAQANPAAEPTPTKTASADPGPGSTGNAPGAGMRSQADVKKTCAGATMWITMAAENQDASDAPKLTQLYLETAQGNKSIERPAEMREHTAVGLACIVAETDGKPYFVVEYGDLPYGCNFCEWFYLYDADGRQLTHSDPAILTDASLPEGSQQSSNTREYEQKIQSLGIKHPTLDYINEPPTQAGDKLQAQ